MGAPHFLDFFIFSYLEKQMHQHLLFLLLLCNKINNPKGQSAEPAV